MSDTNDSFANHMANGAALHAAGQSEQALLAFEKALALRPDSANAASACATLLTVLEQHLAAYRVLCSVREQLLAHADGATNLAIAAEDCGQLDEARAAYARALELDPQNLRALTNVGLLSAREGDWDAAIGRLQHCVRLAPHTLTLWLNLADTLTAARRFDAATETLAGAEQHFSANTAIRTRRALVLAFDGQIEAAQNALDALGPQASNTVRSFLSKGSGANARIVGKAQTVAPDAYDLFCTQAFDALQTCDWRDDARLTAVVREMLARMVRTGQPRDARDTQFYGLVLPLTEDEMAQLRVFSIAAIGGQLKSPMAPFLARRTRGRDPRVHVGLASQSLHDARFANALQRQLLLHDRARFALHVYSSTPRPDLHFTERMAAIDVSVVEIAHMTDDEAVARMRLDELDLFVDMAFDTPWCRPEIPERRVAPVQIRQLTWHRHHPPRPCEYNMSDRFVHPDGIPMEKYGAVVRLPHTCWLATNDDLPEGPPLTRMQAGLPEDALVLCALLPALMIDRQSFALWMRLLLDLPHALLLLPAYVAAARTNLARAALAAGVQAERLRFLPPASRARMLSHISLADLFVDTLRFNANHGLVDALRMGVPAVTCAGNSMASRLGGSIVRAAGLGDLVLNSPGAYVDTVLRLGQDRNALGQLRAHLAHQHALAPLFNAQARVLEWEAAWIGMVEQHAAGTGPRSFDVPEARTASAPLS